jgi:DNA repair ATPase RecN
MDLDAFVKSAASRIAAIEQALEKFNPELLKQVVDAAKAFDPKDLAKLEPLVEEVGDIIAEVKTITGQMSQVVGDVEKLYEAVTGLNERVANLELAANGETAAPKDEPPQG